jgi:hypothetical protein
VLKQINQKLVTSKKLRTHFFVDGGIDVCTPIRKGQAISLGAKKCNEEKKQTYTTNTDLHFRRCTEEEQNSEKNHNRWSVEKSRANDKVVRLT